MYNAHLARTRPSSVRRTKSVLGAPRPAWSLIGFCALLTACSNEDWRNLDHRQDRDVAATAEDFSVYPNARISYRVNYHPDVWQNLLRQDVSDGIEGFEQSRSELEAGLLNRKLVRLGLPEDMVVVAGPIPNNGRNLLISMNFGPASGKELYSVTFTARQGSLYHEAIRSPAEPNSQVDFVELVSPDEHQRINTAFSMAVDSTEMVTDFLGSLPGPSSAPEQ